MHIFAIGGIDEVREYLNEFVHNHRLREACYAIIQLRTNNPHEVFGDNYRYKILSSITLFDETALKIYFHSC